MKRQTAAFIAMVLSLAIGVIGCGGGGGESGTTPELTKAQLIKQGDAICAKVATRYAARLEKLSQQASNPKNPSKQEQDLLIVEAAVPPLRVAAVELEKLSPPAADAEQVEAIVAAFEDATDGVESNPGGELGGPKSPFAELDKLAGAYGFKVCSGF